MTYSILAQSPLDVEATKSLIGHWLERAMGAEGVDAYDRNGDRLLELSGLMRFYDGLRNELLDVVDRAVVRAFSAGMDSAVPLCIAVASEPLRDPNRGIGEAVETARETIAELRSQIRQELEPVVERGHVNLP